MLSRVQKGKSRENRVILTGPKEVVRGRRNEVDSHDDRRIACRRIVVVHGRRSACRRLQ